MLFMRAEYVTKIIQNIVLVSLISGIRFFAQRKFPDREFKPWHWISLMAPSMSAHNLLLF